MKLNEHQSLILYLCFLNLQHICNVADNNGDFDVRQLQIVYDRLGEILTVMKNS